MKTLVIHPQDKTTDFLIPIYMNMGGFPDFEKPTVIRGGMTKTEVHQEIQQHDRIIMMGHGSPSGLFSISQFPGAFGFIIDQLTVPLLQEKENIFIWCNADQFVNAHKLKGLYSGMFISEVVEAIYCKVETTQDQVDTSNHLFSYLLGAQLMINPDLDRAHQIVGSQYSILSESNKVIGYNSERWFING